MKAKKTLRVVDTAICERFAEHSAAERDAAATAKALIGECRYVEAALQLAIAAAEHSAWDALTDVHGAIVGA